MAGEIKVSVSLSPAVAVPPTVNVVTVSNDTPVGKAAKGLTKTSLPLIRFMVAPTWSADRRTLSFFWSAEPVGSDVKALAVAIF